MALSLQNLPELQELLETHKILIQTPEGVKQIPLELFGISVSSTSLFETYTKNIISNLDTKNLSTSTRIQRYLAQDISDEVYTELHDGSMRILKGEVLLDNQEPLTIQAVDMSGNLLYWDNSIENCEWSNGLPWRTSDGKKIAVTYEETAWPVITYRYLTTVLKSVTIQYSGNQEPTIEEVYDSGLDNLKGVITKTPTSFTFKTTSNFGECGITVKRNADGSLSGQLLGSWAGLNDIDPEHRITKDNLKEIWYNDQDYYTYIVAMNLDTSDKIGWYLNNDTRNKVYAVYSENSLTFLYAMPNTNSSTGSYIKEQAVNIFGKNLFWKQDMSDNVGITNNRVPLKSGNFAYMTTEETAWPVYIWQYSTIELFKIIPDGSNGVKQSFSDASGNISEIHQTSAGLEITYKRVTSSTPSKVVLTPTGGTLVGDWSIQSSSGTHKIVTDQESPDYEVVAPVSGVANITMYPNKTFIIDQVGGTITLNVSLPSGLSGTIESKILVPDSTVTASWSNNVKGQNLEVSAEGNTEYTLKAHIGNSTNVYVSKVVYGS